MEPFPLKWAADVLGAEIVGDADVRLETVCTDTRQGAHNALFFALQGENTDGHKFVPQAFAAGAAAAVVSHKLDGVTGPQLIVANPLHALGTLAKHYRRQFAIPVIGITGSVGKTSTKEMIAAILRAQYPNVASAKNLNTEIGVPLTLFQLAREHRVAVIEMGMRGLGEIDWLTEIAEPNIGLITGIGHSHIERLGSREKIAEAKSELLARLPEDSVAVLPAHDPFFPTLLARTPEHCRIVRFSTDPNSDAEVRLVRAEAPKSPTDGQEFTFSLDDTQHRVRLKVPGTHHIPNALAALAIARTLLIPMPQAIAALETWEGAEGRMTVRTPANGTILLDDCYNAGPESMEAALKTLHQMAGDRGIAILGDMRELGEFGPEAHRRVGRAVIENRVRRLLTVGRLAEEIALTAGQEAKKRAVNTPDIHLFADTEEVVQAVAGIIQPKDIVLIKGSRALQMERIVHALIAAASHETGETDVRTEHGRPDVSTPSSREAIPND